MTLDDRKHKVVLLDAVEGLQALPPLSIDCLVTSPPYFGLRSYTNDPREIGKNTTFAKFLDSMEAIAKAAHNAMKVEGSLWINIGESYSGGEPMNVPWAVRDRFAKYFKLRNTVIWYKPDSMAESVDRRFSQKWEPFFWFTKSKHYYFNTQASKIPVTRSFAERLEHKFNTTDEDVSRMRGLQGDVSAKVEQYLAKGVNAGDLWMIPKDKDRTGHPAPFPVALATRPIVATCPPNGLVYDPFAGSGTVGVATYRMGEGRIFTGTDISEQFIDIAMTRITDEREQGTLF